MYSAPRRWSDRVKQLEVPLFDGYVFCQVDVNARLPVLVTPSVLQFVGLGKTPVAIDENEIEAIQKVVLSGSRAVPWPFLKDGDRVQIAEGPLRDVQGILLRTERDHQVVISVTLLQRSIAVRMEREWIIPVRPWLRNSSADNFSRA